MTAKNVWKRVEILSWTERGKEMVRYSQKRKRNDKELHGKTYFHFLFPWQQKRMKKILEHFLYKLFQK